MNTADKVIQVAMNEVGYLEKSKTAYQKNPDIIYEKTAGAGQDNYTKYGKIMHDIYPSVMDFPAAWCFTEGTMILTSEGYKPIEHLHIGDKVLNAYGDSFNEVIDIATRLAKVCEVRAYGMPKLITTLDHPFLSTKRLGVRKDWKQTKLAFNPISELKHGDNLIIPHTGIINKNELSYDDAWIVGYFVGDGWKSSKGSYYLCGNSKKEIEIFKHIKSIHKGKDYQSRTCFEYQIIKDDNEKIIRVLDEVGCGASNKEVPKSILFAEKEVKHAFIDGYLTADGTKDGKFSTVSKKLAYGIVKIVFDLGYGCSLRECVRDENQEIFDKRINRYRKIHINPIIYCGAINKNESKAHRMDRTINNLVYTPLKHCNTLETDMLVYNITTNNDHTYLANNLAVHNCDCFVDWCFYQAYGITTAKSLLGGNFNDYTVASAGMYAKNNAIDSTPKIGDQVFFTRNGKISGCYHTGIVYDVDSTYFYTIEGNTSKASTVVSNGGGVAKKKYSIKQYKGKTLFGHPKYDTELKSLDEIAKEVIQGKWGSGATRRANLTDAGYNYSMVQSKVNELLSN